MRRELHVRFCEGPGVRFPRATRLLVGFQLKSDADRFLGELRERLRKFALELHPEKTRMPRFGRFAAKDRAERGEGKPETFDFLGFTHICAKTRGGEFMLKRRTTAKRMRAKLHEIRLEVQRRRHRPIPEQGAWLGAVVRGYFAYHAVPTNTDRLEGFRTEIIHTWHRALRRRGQRDRTNWTRMGSLANRWIPFARVLHPWPQKRFDVRTRGRSPVR